jgi:hypothetical protein
MAFLTSGSNASRKTSDLVRAREAAGDDLRRKRQQLLSFLLRHGRIYTAGRDKTNRRDAVTLARLQACDR